MLTGCWLLVGFLLPTVLWVMQLEPWRVVSAEDSVSRGTLTRRGAEWLARRQQLAQPDRVLEVVSRAEHRRRVALDAARTAAALARGRGGPVADLPLQSPSALQATPAPTGVAASRARPVVLA